MAEKPDETSGSAEIGPAPWPPVGRSMINYNAPAAPAQAAPVQAPVQAAPSPATGQFPAPMGSTPYEDVPSGARWPRVVLVLTGLVLLVAATAVLVVLVALPWFS
ncbi:hypothetical protein SK571_41500 [Lentzea sp. BCCO 10_0798]|jgi:hypothetical protein|uniref:Serine/threonine protein kinase n=1 Tax=Lentzea kristufekii TaxID=3095430 RepID=A0ABU4U600_9PSEU|nr:hypothetical protein [Lentzea sp. BCCO 10_0798]MDX8055892.1 hypothetical protein [Lentzea sp. BCCO 10_0798]